MKEIKLDKIFCFFIIFLLISCSNADLKEKIDLEVEKNQITSGKSFKLSYTKNLDYKTVNAFLISNKEEIIESYGIQKYKDSFIINRFLNKNIDFQKNYFIALDFKNENNLTQVMLPIQIGPSVIINSFCVSLDCDSNSGNVVQEVYNRINISLFKIAAVKINYTIVTPYESFSYTHNFSSPTDLDWLDNVVLKKVPEEYSSYVATLHVKVYDIDNNYAETYLPFRVVRPIEVKHFGKYELAETYEPVPVTGCIPGTIGNNVQYSESESEIRQNSVGITLSRNWSNSDSTSVNSTQMEGISIGETEDTVVSSSLSESETISESESNSFSNSESANISFSSSDGENWSWSLGEAETQGTSNSSTNSSNTGVNGSVTTGFSGEGSLPFLAKASGKVEVSAGVSQGWGSSDTNGSSSSDTTSRGYTTGGSAQNSTSYGSISNDVRSHSLSGSYVLSSSTSNTITEANGKSSGRVWNMSESIGSGRIVTEGNSENISETIVTSNSSSTTFSYSAYIPRGRYGVFYRQTSRYVKLSEIITYDLDGFPSHAGFIQMNSWAWAPELSIGEDCLNMPEPNLPQATCFIAPCGE